MLALLTATLTKVYRVQGGKAVLWRIVPGGPETQAEVVAAARYLTRPTGANASRLRLDKRPPVFHPRIVSGVDRKNRADR